jgi:dihydrofolate reductase
MRKVIAAINVSLDGYCDHTSMIADDALHHHFADLLRTSGTLLYGRITYQLMEYWRSVVAHPTGNPATDDFAVLMDNTPKVVFSSQLKRLDWNTARLATQDLQTEVIDLKQQPGKPILVGSPSLITALLDLHLMDELQLCIHPVLVGQGKLLFTTRKESIPLKLMTQHVLPSGVIVVTYQPIYPNMQHYP